MSRRLLLTAACALLVAACAGSTAPPDHDVDRTAPVDVELCEGLTPQRCYFQGMKYQAQDKPARAVGFFEEVCEAGLAHACYDLGLMYEKGAGVEADLQRAVSLYERACEDLEPPDGDACSNLGLLYEKGRGVEANARTAADLYEVACEHGSMLGCSNLAGLYVSGEGVEAEPPAGPERAERLLERACRAGFGAACPRWSYLHGYACLTEATPCPDDALNPKTAAATLAEACKGGDAVACLGHGFLAEVEMVPGDPALLYEEACEAGVQAGCNFLANLHVEGKVVEGNSAYAGELYEKACEAGFALSCHTLGMLHLNGERLERDEALGYELVGQACALGRSSSCFGLEFRCVVGDAAACQAFEALDTPGAGDAGEAMLTGEAPGE